MTKGRDIRALAAVVLISAIVSAAGLLWASRNPSPQGRDEYIHLRNAFELTRMLREDPVHFLSFHVGTLTEIFSQDVYPPLGYSLSALMKNALGIEDYMSSVAALALFVLASNVLVYLIGARLHSPEAGLLAALLFCAYPLVFALSHTYSPNFMQLPFVLLAFLLLLKSESFTRPGATIAFGAAVGLGVLCYYASLLTVLLPAVWIVLARIARPGRPATPWARNLALAALCALIIGAPFYLRTYLIERMAKDWHMYAGGLRPIPAEFALGDPAKFNTAVHAFFYLYILPGYQIGIAATVGVALGLLSALIAKRKDLLLVFLAAVGPVLFLTFVRNKWTERTLIALPFIALLTVIPLLDWKRKTVGRILLAAILIATVGVTASALRSNLRGFEQNLEHGNRYTDMAPLFERIAATGMPITFGVLQNRQLPEYFAALHGIRARFLMAKVDPAFYRQFDEIDLLIVQTNAPEQNWIDRDELTRQIRERGIMETDEVTEAALEHVLGSKKDFRLMGAYRLRNERLFFYLRKGEWTDRISTEET